MLASFHSSYLLLTFWYINHKTDQRKRLHSCYKCNLHNTDSTCIVVKYKIYLYEVFIPVFITIVNSSNTCFSSVRVAESSVFCEVLSRNYVVLLSFLFLAIVLPVPFRFTLLITPLVSSNLSVLQSMQGSD